MLTHPLVLSVLALIALVYLGGALLMFLQVRYARPGYEDEDGFHYAEPIENAVVPADEERPSWFTGALAERFSQHRAELLARGSVMWARAASGQLPANAVSALGR